MNEKREKKNYFDFPTGALVALVAFVAMIVFQAIVVLLPISDTATTWICVLGNQVVIVATCIVAAKQKKVDIIAVTGVKRPPKAYIFPFFILIAAACVAAFGPLAGMIAHLLSRVGYTYQANYAIPWDNAGLFTLAFLALVILPPIGEETLFRGVLLSGAKRKAPLFAIIYTAISFALFHGNLNQLVHQFLLALVMGYLAVVTGGILASVVVHAMNNGLALLLEYFHYHGMIDNKFYGYFEGDYFFVSWEILVGIIASMMLLIGLLVLVTYLLRREKEKEAGEFPESDDTFLREINAFLAYMSYTPKENEERQTEQAEESARAAQDSMYATYRIVLPILYVLVLALVVILGVFVGNG